MRAPRRWSCHLSGKCGGPGRDADRDAAKGGLTLPGGGLLWGPEAAAAAESRAGVMAEVRRRGEGPQYAAIKKKKGGVFVF